MQTGQPFLDSLHPSRNPSPQDLAPFSTHRIFCAQISFLLKGCGLGSLGEMANSREISASHTLTK